MVVKEAMHNITKVPASFNVAQAAKVMDQKIIGSVLVEENNKIIGIMTERDILRKVVAAGRRGEELSVKEVMTSPLKTIDAYAPLHEASDLLSKHKVRRLIVTEKNEIIGVITARNVAENLKYSLAKKLHEGSGDKYGRPDFH